MRWQYVEEDDELPCQGCNGGGQVTCQNCNSEGATLL